MNTLKPLNTKPLNTMNTTNATFTKTDAEILNQIREELRWDCRTEGHAVNIDVVDGAVTLSGKVKNYAVKCAAEEATHRIAGVQSVANEIVVKIPYLDFKADKEIVEAVTYMLEWNVLIPDEQITVEVAWGWVTLEGEVDCWSQREEAERAVSHLAGVCGVRNNIRVNAPAVQSESVCEAIAATLERHSPQEARQVQIAMQNGAVRLSGKVPSWGERCVVMHIAGYAPGVRQVIDDLKIAVAAN